VATTTRADSRDEVVEFQRAFDVLDLDLGRLDLGGGETHDERCSFSASSSSKSSEPGSCPEMAASVSHIARTRYASFGEPLDATSNAAITAANRTQKSYIGERYDSSVNMGMDAAAVIGMNQDPIVPNGISQVIYDPQLARKHPKDKQLQPNWIFLGRCNRCTSGDCLC
jgi:hypothetical protein